MFVSHFLFCSKCIWVLLLVCFVCCLCLFSFLLLFFVVVFCLFIIIIIVIIFYYYCCCFKFKNYLFLLKNCLVFWLLFSYSFFLFCCFGCVLLFFGSLLLKGTLPLYFKIAVHNTIVIFKAQGRTLNETDRNAQWDRQERSMRQIGTLNETDRNAQWDRQERSMRQIGTRSLQVKVWTST